VPTGRGVRSGALTTCLNMSSKRFAAIDLGSLTVRLAVAAKDSNGRLRVLKHLREVTGLGQGLAQTGSLTPEGMDRTLTALKKFLQEIKNLKVEAVRAVATQAVRQAQNRQVFLDRVQDELGLKVRVITPEEEARLSLAGVLTALAPEFLQAPEMLVFDVGGGSSEFALLRPGREPRFASLPLGVLTLSQTHPVGNPPEAARVAALRQAALDELTGFANEALQPHLAGVPRLVGTAGAVTTLAAMQLGLRKYDPGKINNFILTRSRLTALAERVSALSEADRARLPGMEPAKAGVMVAGAWLVWAISQVFRQDLLVVIDAGLLEGVLQVLSFEF